MTADHPQGSPHAAAALNPRTSASGSAPGGRRDPVPDDTDRVPTGMAAAAIVAVAAAVAAVGAGRAAPSTAGPAATMKRVPCRRAGGNPDPTAHRKRAARGRRAFRIRERRRAGTRPTTIRRVLAGLAARIRAGLGIALTEVAKVRARTRAAEEGARAQKLGSVNRLETPSPGRRQRQYKGRKEDRTTQKLTTAIRNINERQGGSGSCDRSGAAHEGAGGSSSGPAKLPPSPKTHRAAEWFQ